MPDTEAVTGEESPSPNIALAQPLLGLASLSEQRAFLRASNRLDAATLSSLVDLAEEQMGEDPARARHLTEMCGALAEELGEIGLAGRSVYQCALTYYLNAEFETALGLIDVARQHYLHAGLAREALRTDAGRMAVLMKLGRYAETLDFGRNIISTLSNADDSKKVSDDAEVNQLIGMAEQNSGLAYELTGHFEQALAAYAAAEDRFRALNLPERVGDISNNRGWALLNLGRVREALAAFEIAADLFDAHAATHKRAQALMNAGDAQLLLGKYSHGLAALEQARALLDPMQAETAKQELLLDLADAHLTLNLYPEALAEYREALRDVGVTHDHARALWGAGSALLAQGYWQEAADVLAQAASAFETAPNLPMLCEVRLQQAALLMELGEQSEALDRAQRVLAATSGKPWPLQQASAQLRLAALLFPDAQHALPHIYAAEALADTVALPSLTQQVQQALGHAHLLLGAYAEAEKHLLSAVASAERSRLTLVQERMRAAFLGDKQAAYEDLVRLYLLRHQTGDIERAFEMTERAASRALIDVLSGHIAAASLDGGEDEVQRSLRAAQNELDATYTALLRADPADDLDQLQDKALHLEREISRAQLSLVTPDTPEQGGDMSGKALGVSRPPATNDNIFAKLPDDCIVISYMTCGDEIAAFIVANHTVIFAQVIGKVAQVQPWLAKLQTQLNRFREDRAFVERQMSLLTQSAQNVLKALHTALIQPLSAALLKAANDMHTQKLIVVPHGLLHQVPFHALFDGTRYLIDAFDVSSVPSLEIWALCQARPAPDSSRAAVFGVTDDLIPEAAIEAQTVARTLARWVGNAQLRLDGQATLAEFQACAPGCGIVHVACHGFFRVDNPMFSALRMGDGWLMALDVPGLDLRGALVVLSACESGRSQVMAGDELMGLVRGFLGAGASTLVTSLWLAHDETTALLMQHFYAHLNVAHGAGSRAEALRKAQLAVKESHPHPYYWAPFVLTGRR